MGLLDTLLSDPSQQQAYQEFAGRYQQGPPQDVYSDQEVAERYQQVAPNLSPQEYQVAAEQSFARLSPQERLQLAQLLQQQGVGTFGPGTAVDQYQDPRRLAEATAQLHQQQPGLLGGLLGANPLVKAALAGITATAVSRALGGTAGRGAATGVQYRIANMASGKLLANPQGSRDNGTRIIQWDNDGGPEQAWQLEAGPHGGTRLRNAASGKLLANPQGSRDNGTGIIQWQDDGGPEQEWALEPGRQGGVRIRNLASRLLLANPQGSRDNGTAMIQWQDDGGVEQEWQFDPPLPMR